MKVAILIPTRDRPQFLANCLRMMQAQTVQPDHIEIVDDAPLSAAKDITWRYRNGYDRLRNKGFDAILFIEDDDWYAPNYIETMLREWQKHGKPDIFGTNYTIYYHLKLKAWFTMNHPERASAMNTLIKPDLEINWCPDHEPYTDLHLWFSIKGIAYTPEKIIAIGMKHGEGTCGGRNHTDKLERFKIADADLRFLAVNLDRKSMEFYKNLY
jgi:glycosyltransferase involved in cell wall biosynthesis